MNNTILTESVKLNILLLINPYAVESFALIAEVTISNFSFHSILLHYKLGKHFLVLPDIYTVK